MSKYVRRSVSLPPELEEFIRGKKAKADEQGFEFVFSHYVARLIEEKVQEEARASEAVSTGAAREGVWGAKSG